MEERHTRLLSKRNSFGSALIPEQPSYKGLFLLFLLYSKEHSTSSHYLLQIIDDPKQSYQGLRTILTLAIITNQFDWTCLAHPITYNIDILLFFKWMLQSLWFKVRFFWQIDGLVNSFCGIFSHIFYVTSCASGLYMPFWEERRRSSGREASMSTYIFLLLLSGDMTQSTKRSLTFPSLPVDKLTSKFVPCML